MKKAIYMLLSALTLVGIVYLPETKTNVSLTNTSLTVSIFGRAFTLDKRQVLWTDLGAPDDQHCDKGFSSAFN